MQIGIGNEGNYQEELKIVGEELKQLTMDTVKLFQELMNKGVLSEGEYNQLVKLKLEFLSNFDILK